MAVRIEVLGGEEDGFGLVGGEANGEPGGFVVGRLILDGSKNCAGLDGNGGVRDVFDVGDDEYAAVAPLFLLKSGADDGVLDLVAFEEKEGGVFEGEVLLDAIQGGVCAGGEEEYGEQGGEEAESVFHG